MLGIKQGRTAPLWRHYWQEGNSSTKLPRQGVGPVMSTVYRLVAWSAMSRNLRWEYLRERHISLYGYQTTSRKITCWYTVQLTGCYFFPLEYKIWGVLPVNRTTLAGTGGGDREGEPKAGGELPQVLVQPISRSGREPCWRAALSGAGQPDRVTARRLGY